MEVIYSISTVAELRGILNNNETNKIIQITKDFDFSGTVLTIKATDTVTITTAPSVVPGSCKLTQKTTNVRHFSVSGKLILKNIILDGGSTAGNRGGVSLSGTATLIMEAGSVIRNNQAANGGGVYLDGTSIFTMESGEISSNIATNNGGGVYVNVSSSSLGLTMNGGYIFKNKANGTDEYNSGGGGVHLNRGIFIMEDGEITDNQVEKNGGGVFIGNQGATFRMNDGKIGRNIAKISGGGINLHGATSLPATFVMTGGSVFKNEANGPGNANGGGALFINTGVATLKGGDITENIAKMHGGGVFININSTFELENGRMCSNIAEQLGGGVLVLGGTTFLMRGGRVERNVAKVNGGGVYNNGTLTMTGGKMISNVAIENGGGISVSGPGSKFEFKKGRLSSNKAGVYGGAVYIGNLGNFVMEAGIISYNKAATSGGGIYTLDYNNIKTSALSFFGGNRTSVANVPMETYPSIQSAHSSIRDFYLVNNFDVNQSGTEFQAFYDFFPDRNLAAVIAESLGALPYQLTCEAELESLKKLIAPNKKISSLEGLERLKSLEELNLNGNAIMDLQPLKSLPLKSWQVAKQKVHLSPVKVGVPGKAVYNRDGQAVLLMIEFGDGELQQEGGVIWHHTGMNEVLWEQGNYSGRIKQVSLKNQISQIFPDKYLARIVANTLNKKVTTPINLTELYSITEINADNQGISSLEGMSFLVWLNKLSLSQNQVTELAPLQRLPLKSLKLNQNPNLKLAGIETLTTLETLLLNDCFLNDITNLASLRNLKTLSLQGNQLATLSPLAELKQLRVLNLAKTYSSDFAGLVFPELLNLRLDNNAMADLSKLPTMPKIKILLLNGNIIQSVEPLAKLKTLEKLEINRNNIKKIASLTTLSKLFVLEVSGNEIEDIEELKKMPSLVFWTI